MFQHLPKTISDVSLLRSIPLQSTCEQMIDLLIDGNYSAVSCRAGTFTEQLARVILNVHNCKLREIRSRVKDEEQWIKTGISLPTRSCSYSDDDMTKYTTLIFDYPDRKNPGLHILVEQYPFETVEDTEVLKNSNLDRHYGKIGELKNSAYILHLNQLCTKQMLTKVNFLYLGTSSEFL